MMILSLITLSPAPKHKTSAPPSAFAAPLASTPGRLKRLFSGRLRLRGLFPYAYIGGYPAVERDTGPLALDHVRGVFLVQLDDRARLDLQAVYLMELPVVPAIDIRDAA